MHQRSSIAIILNAGAGTVKARPNIEGELRELFQAAGREVEIVAVQPGQNPVDAARDAAGRASIVAAAGGDGTISSVAAGIIDTAAALGVLPLGSRNHFAKDLDIPLDLAGAIAVIAAGHVGSIDVGRVNDRVFINNSSIGIYSGMVEAREELREQGHRKWPAMILATWEVFKSYPNMTVTLKADGRARTFRTPFVFVGNNEYVIDGLQIGARARLDQGKLFAYLTPKMRTRDLPMLVAKALVGRARQSGDFAIVPAADLTISAWRARHMAVSFDGEIETMSLPLRYRVCPGGLRVVLPRP